MSNNYFPLGLMYAACYCVGMITTMFGAWYGVGRVIKAPSQSFWIVGFMPSPIFKPEDRVKHLYHGGQGTIILSKQMEQMDEEIWYRVLFDGENFYRAVPEDYLRPINLN